MQVVLVVGSFIRQDNCAYFDYFRSSSNIESSIKELIDVVKIPLTEDELECMMNADPTHREPDAYTALLNNFAQKNVDAFISCTLIILFYFIYTLAHVDGLISGRS